MVWIAILENRISLNWAAFCFILLSFYLNLDFWLAESDVYNLQDDEFWDDIEAIFFGCHEGSGWLLNGTYMGGNLIFLSKADVFGSNF